MTAGYGGPGDNTGGGAHGQGDNQGYSPGYNPDYNPTDGSDTHRQYDSVTDAIPPPEQVQGGHDTYDKGEVSSIGEIISDITANLTTLMRQEVELAKAEVQQSAKRAGKGAGMLGAAGVAGHFALLFLSLLVWWLLADLFNSLGWAFLAVAVIWGVIAAILASSGRKKLKTVEGMPRTVDTAKHVPDALKGNDHA